MLLNWLLGEVTHNGGPAILRLVPDDLTSRPALISAVGTASGCQPLTRNLIDRLGVRPGRGGPELSFESASGAASRGVRSATNAVGSPLLITLDEAHTVPPDILKTLLDTVQHAGTVSAVGVVLAGTPGLEDMLSGNGTSYWDRGDPLPVGRLDAEEAERVIAGPFERAGIATDDGGAAAVAKGADYYPYFLQIYGEAAWNAVKALGTQRLGPEQADAAILRGNERRQRYFRTRHEEFIQAGARALGRSVSIAFRDAGGCLSERQMEALLRREYGDGLDEPGRRRFLRTRGFIWRPGDTSPWEPGIPSLVDYMISVTGPEPERETAYDSDSWKS